MRGESASHVPCMRLIPVPRLRDVENANGQSRQRAHATANQNPRTAAAIWSRGIFGVLSAYSNPFASWYVSENCV